MKVVITGVSGFIGGELFKKFVSKGIFSIGVTRKKKPGNWTLVDNYSQAPDGDVLIHCAEPSVVSHVNSYDSDFIDRIIETSEALIKKPYKKVIYLSTGSLYGDKSPIPRLPSDQTITPDNYRFMKKKIEGVVLSRRGTVLRLANVYGKGMSEFNVVSAITQHITKNEPIKLKSVKPVRDFVYIQDIVTLVERVCMFDTGGIYNVGTGIGHSIDDLVSLMQKICKTNLEVVCDEISNLSGNSVNILDISDTVRALDWLPEYNLERGLRSLAFERNLIYGERYEKH